MVSNNNDNIKAFIAVLKNNKNIAAVFAAIIVVVVIVIIMIVRNTMTKQCDAKIKSYSVVSPCEPKIIYKESEPQIIYKDSPATPCEPQIIYKDSPATPCEPQIIYKDSPATPCEPQIIYKDSLATPCEPQIIYRDSEPQIVYRDSPPQIIYKDSPAVPCTQVPCAPVPCEVQPCAQVPCASVPCEVQPCVQVPCAPVPCTQMPCAPVPCTQMPCSPPDNTNIINEFMAAARTYLDAIRTSMNNAIKYASDASLLADNTGIMAVRNFADESAFYANECVVINDKSNTTMSQLVLYANNLDHIKVVAYATELKIYSLNAASVEQYAYAAWQSAVNASTPTPTTPTTTTTTTTVSVSDAAELAASAAAAAAAAANAKRQANARAAANAQAAATAAAQLAAAAEAERLRLAAFLPNAGQLYYIKTSLARALYARAFGTNITLAKCDKTLAPGACRWKFVQSVVNPTRYLIQASDNPNIYMRSVGPTSAALVDNIPSTTKCDPNTNAPDCQWSLVHSATRDGNFYIKNDTTNLYMQAMGADPRNPDINDIIQLGVCPQDQDLDSCQWKLEI